MIQQTSGYSKSLSVPANNGRYLIPTYLRVVVTRACPMHCPFCHHEGILSPKAETRNTQQAPSQADRPRGHASLQAWLAMLETAARFGIRKFKFLGGEALMAPDLPAMVAHVKQVCPDSDVSVITSGAASTEALDACFRAGLDRANLSIHGWTWEAFRTNGDKQQYEQRRNILQMLLNSDRPIKLNYVYLGARSEPDLMAFLHDMSAIAGTRGGVVANVLDNLADSNMSPDTIRELLPRLCGPPVSKQIDADPHSLPAERWRWASGLVVEIKSSILGQTAPWPACQTCRQRHRCREGTFALRLDPSGDVRLCMDRPDLRFSLLDIARHDPGDAVALWKAAFKRVARGGNDSAAGQVCRVNAPKEVSP